MGETSNKRHLQPRGCFRPGIPTARDLRSNRCFSIHKRKLYGKTGDYANAIVQGRTAEEPLYCLPEAGAGVGKLYAA